MKREEFLQQVSAAFKAHPIVAILGPRQCGKTTLARMFGEEFHNLKSENYFDLEDVDDLARLDSPKSALSELEGFIVIDEVQRKPHLFQTLRVLVDRPKSNKQFLILGSASKELLQQSSETLTGRIFYIELTPFKFNEVEDLQRLWHRGGFPRSFLAIDDPTSFSWRKSYLRTFVEQDIPNLGFKVPAEQLKRFWQMLTHYHGTIFNASEIGRSLNLSYKTVQQYVDILTDTLMVRQLKPWHANISKRQVKSPKIYFRDSGLFHTLLGINQHTPLLMHPKLGNSWEGFALEEVIRHMDVDPDDCYFWATHANAELDLLILKDNKRIGFEFKFSDRAKTTKSMAIAMNDLKLDRLIVIYRGENSYKLGEKIYAEGLVNFLSKKFK